LDDPCGLEALFSWGKATTLFYFCLFLRILYTTTIAMTAISTTAVPTEIKMIAFVLNLGSSSF
jgi:hypothetical protein